MATDMESSAAAETRTSRLVHLNVGGVIYTASRETLTSNQNSMLAIMFNQQKMPPAEKDESGQYLIDRDGQLFRYVLNYLRNGELNLPREFSEYKQLLAEATFYQINPLIEEIQTIFDKDESVNLNVGGKRYVASKSNLSKFKESLLCRMLTNEDQTIRRDDHGNFTIDRDGVLFRHILNYLRDGELNLPKDFPELKQLLAEARFYQIKSLEEEVLILLEDEEDITFLVRGLTHKTRKANLIKYAGSSFGKMFTNRQTFKRDTKGRYVIEEDGELFRHVLDFMEKGKLHLPRNFHKHQRLCAQANGFGLMEMVQAIEEKLAGSDIIHLNVGGVRYVTRRRTLCKFHWSFFWKKFNDENVQGLSLHDGTVSQDNDGNYFIDRNGDLFRYVLDFLLNGKLALPENFCQHKQLLLEANHYGIPINMVLALGPSCS